MTELDALVRKFNQLCYDGYEAHLGFNSHAGKAWACLRVRIRDARGPPCYQQKRPQFPRRRQRAANGPSRQRRRSRREAARQQEQNVPNKAVSVEDSAIDVIDKPENIKETEDIGVEEASIANETELVEEINDGVIDKPLAFEDTEEIGVEETFEIGVAETPYIAAEEAADKVLQVDIHGGSNDTDCLDDNEEQNTEETRSDNAENSNFYFSTPRKTFPCEECEKGSECTDCIAVHMLGMHGIAKATFLSFAELEEWSLIYPISGCSGSL